VGGDENNWIALARITKPRGNRGEVAAQDLCEDLDRFAEGTEVKLRDTAGRWKTAKIENAWDHEGRLILKFEGVDSISAAEELRGAEVCVPYEELGPPPEGEHYYVDLVGCVVREADTDREIGVVEGILEPGGALLLEVRHGGREILIPFIREICVDVEPEKKSIRVRMPEGLEELNA
jgi:16S rRNA processing protein RimM